METTKKQYRRDTRRSEGNVINNLITTHNQHSTGLAGLSSFAKKTLYILLLIAASYSCGKSDQSQAAQSITFSTVDADGNSGINSFRTTVIRDTSSWSALWNEHKQNTIPSPAPPSIDFTQKMVIGVFLGSRPNICYSASITSISLINDQKLVVTYHEGRPSEDALCGLAISHPAHIVSLNYSNLPVEFVEQ